jgi:hypothetical protein
MKITRAKYPSRVFILIGALAFIVAVIALCASLCPVDTPGIDLFQQSPCGLTSHALVSIWTGLFSLFILPLIGTFLDKKMLTIPSGFFSSPFKPPRLFRMSTLRCFIAFD